MSSVCTSYQDMSSSLSSSKLQTRKSKQPIAAVSSSHFPKSSPMKPMRPLTAYHIFFQIEREYIIQTTPGADADSSIHNHKSYLQDVPRRYSNIKLSTDWYAGPGKRAKRKHRKSHGKIGFLELSRVVSQRWANLGELDPETKAFVTGIAKREFAEYKHEMQEYEAAVASMHGKAKVEAAAPAAKVTKTTQVKKTGTKRTARKVANTLPSLPSVTAPEDVPSSFTYKRSGTLVTPPATPPPAELFFTTEFDINSVFVDVLPDAAFSTSIESIDNISLPEEDVDYSISYVDNAGHHVPSPAGSVCEGRKRSFSEESICDPLFELEMPSVELYENSPKRRRMSVGAVDRELFNLWA